MDWYVDTQETHAVSDLRDEIVAYLARHADRGASLDDARLVIGELMSNAVRHARGPMWVSVTWDTERPTVTVRDLGPGFEMPERFLLPPPDSPGGRGLFIVSQLAGPLSAETRRAQGSAVTATLPVRRRVEPSFDPAPRATSPLPAPEEANADGTFGRESFLRALVVQLADAVEDGAGPDAAAGAVAQVGSTVGGRMEQEYRRAHDIDGALTPEQMGELYVGLKRAIDGGFSVAELTSDKIVLTNTRCPFGPVVRRAPSLCRMTSSVFGGIAARNAGGAAVHLEERIAVGDPGCRVTVWLGRVPAEVRPFAHLYGAVDVDTPADAPRP